MIKIFSKDYNRPHRRKQLFKLTGTNYQWPKKLKIELELPKIKILHLPKNADGCLSP